MTILFAYISMCRYFVGARTHATIAAYSCKIPTLVLGYSVKSKGIAQDLFGTYNNFVISVQDLKTCTELVDGFHWLCSNENLVKEKLLTTIPVFTQRCENAKQSLLRIG